MCPKLTVYGSFSLYFGWYFVVTSKINYLKSISELDVLDLALFVVVSVPSKRNEHINNVNN